MFALPLPLLAGLLPGKSLGWHLHPEVLLTVALIEGGYLLALDRLHRLSPHTTRISRRKVLLFTLGVLTMYLATGTPLDELSDDYLVSAHMLQHLVLTMVSPPLLLLGLHDWMLRPLLRRRTIMVTAWIVTRPLIAFAIFNLTFLVVHLPSSVNLELTHEYLVHFPSHVLLVVTAMLMWWPVLSPLPELPRLAYPLQMVYLFVQSFVPAVLSAFVIFSSSVIYPIYATTPRIWGISAINDQRIGGAIMKIGGSAILWGVMAVIFFVWFNEEEREEPPIAPPPGPIVWEDVEDELVRMGITDR